jgi:DNA-binding transcriptional MerR regulator
MKKLLWPWEIARELGVSSATVRRQADAGAVDVIRDAKGRRRFKPEVIDILRVKLGLQDAGEKSLAAAQVE